MINSVTEVSLFSKEFPISLFKISQIHSWKILCLQPHVLEDHQQSVRLKFKQVYFCVLGVMVRTHIMLKRIPLMMEKKYADIQRIQMKKLQIQMDATHLSYHSLMLQNYYM